MLQIGNGKDIVTAIGEIESLEQADALLREKLDTDTQTKMDKIRTPDVRIKIANAIAMCRPQSVFINSGNIADRQYICELSLKNGEEKKLAMSRHTIHYDLKEEQGRIVDRTFYIANPSEQISSLANKIERDQALADIREKMAGIMEGRHMMIGFYVRGPIGARVSNPALEITSSAYVMHSADLLYRHCLEDFDKEVMRAGHFYANVHSQGLNRSEDLPNARVYMDRSHRTTYSVNCTYAGNTLLMKKGNHRFSVDKAIYENRGAELSEHMFITGIKGPGGRVTWCAGAAPSGCGKTTTAMAGDLFVGDDLAQMWINDHGEVCCVNPECGIFGIVEDVNWEGDPKLMERLRKEGTEVIWSNVLVDADLVPHWAGNGEQHPAKGFNFQGDWHEGMTDDTGRSIPLSHPNARCTLVSRALANYSSEAENSRGVVTRIITYSGRDSDTMPPVWVAQNPERGVAIGACIVSAATATEVGASGVKRAPWANAPFIPGALADYMDAQFKFFGNPKIATDKQPVMAGLNYFLTEEARGGSSKKLLGEKRDVRVWLAWLERRVHGEVGAIDTPIGLLPLYEDLKTLFTDIIQKDYPRPLYDQQFSLYVDNILARIELQADAYGKETNVPPKLFEVLAAQKQGLLNLKQVYGAVVTPAQLIEANARK